MSEGREGRGRVRTGGYVGFADLPNQVLTTVGTVNRLYHLHTYHAPDT